MKIRSGLIAVNLAAVTYFLLSFSPLGIGLRPYRIDLDVYRIGGRAWLRGEGLYGALPPTSSGARLPFSYPPMAAVLVSPLSAVPMIVAGIALTLGSIALAGVVLRMFIRALPAGWERPGVWWLLPAGLLLEPMRDTLSLGQVNIALMALVSADCLVASPRWPRGALTGLAAAVKLTPAAFTLFFLLRRDYRAAATSALSFAMVTGAGFLLDWRDSAQYWTSVIFDPARPGDPAFAGNQSISGVIARAGLDPRGQAAAIAWTALSAVVVAVAVIGMRRAFAAAEPAWALSLNAFAALLISPISWCHHWTWAGPAILVLWDLARRRGWRGGLAAAYAGLAVFVVSPPLLLHKLDGADLHWAPWQQAIGSSYVIIAVLALLASSFSCFTPMSPRGLDPRAFNEERPRGMMACR
jgi:alpha-1,2-mannosyltransferase